MTEHPRTLRLKVNATPESSFRGPKVRPGRALSGMDPLAEAFPSRYNTATNGNTVDYGI